MKIIKKIFAALLALPVITGFNACTEEADYNAAKVPGTAQVFFSSDDDSEVALMDNQSEFTINVHRAVKKGELTVNIASTDENGLFTVPGSVTFADGDSVAALKVTFNFSDLTPDTDYPLALNIGNDSTAYGPQTKTYYVKYAPWTEWALFEEGEGVYTCTQYYSGTYTSEVYYRESLVNDEKAQFSFPYVDITVEYNKVTHECSVVPYHYDNHSTYGPVYVADSYTYWHDVREDATVTKDMFPSYYDPETGKFTLNLAYYVGAGYFGYGEEYFQVNGYSQSDYSIGLSVGGNYIDKDGNEGQLIYFKPGADVASYKYAIVAGAFDEEKIATVANDIHYGNIASEESAEEGYKLFMLKEYGDYTVVAISYDAEGTNQAGHSVTFNFTGVATEKPWKSLGYCKYTDDIIITTYSEENGPVTYDVEIQESNSTPGLYRLVNPYGAGYPYNEPGDYTEDDVYVEINATDPDGVYINYQDLGLDWGKGENYIYSAAAYDYLDYNGTLEDAKEAGVTGKLENGVITFPARSIYLAIGQNMYYANTNGAFKIDLNSITAESKARKTTKVNKHLAKSVSFQGETAEKTTTGRLLIKSKSVSAKAVQEYRMKNLRK